MKKELKNRAIRRLKILEGQIRGLQRMIEQGKYCIDVINQSLAAKHALSGVEDLILESHLGNCVVLQMKGGKHKQALKEILSVHRLSKLK